MRTLNAWRAGSPPTVPFTALCWNTAAASDTETVEPRAYPRGERATRAPGLERSPRAVSLGRHCPLPRSSWVQLYYSFFVLIAVPFDFCERPPIISHGFMKSPPENAYHVHSEVHYSCHSGFRMKGPDHLLCHATGCWMPNDLPECIREDLYGEWNPKIQ